MKTETQTAPNKAQHSPEINLVAIRLQDINRINSYLLQCGIEPTQYKIALQHCKEILAQFNAPQGQEIYNLLDKEIGF